MVPDVERQWIAEDRGRGPRPPFRVLPVLVLLLALVIWILRGC